MLANRMMMTKRSNEYAMDSFTKALLHLNGANNSTVFTDESGKVWTPSGNAKISTVQSKFGGASAYFDGAGDCIDTPYNVDFNLSSGDYTFDFWVNRQSGQAKDGYILAQCSSAAANITFFVYIETNGKLHVGHQYGSGTEVSVIAPTALSLDTWHHVAFVKTSTTMYLFIDGVSVATASTASITFKVNTTNKITLGRLGEYNDFFFKGYIDEFRFSKGIARWTANFTPPS